MGDLGSGEDWGPQTQSPPPLSATTAGNLPKATGSGALVFGGQFKLSAEYYGLVSGLVLLSPPLIVKLKLTGL